MTNGQDERMLRLTRNNLWHLKEAAGGIRWGDLEPIPHHSDAEYDKKAEWAKHLEDLIKKREVIWLNGNDRCIQLQVKVDELKAKLDEVWNERQAFLESRNYFQQFAKDIQKEREKAEAELERLKTKYESPAPCEQCSNEIGELGCVHPDDECHAAIGWPKFQQVSSSTKSDTEEK